MMKSSLFPEPPVWINTKTHDYVYPEEHWEHVPPEYMWLSLTTGLVYVKHVTYRARDRQKYGVVVHTQDYPLVELFLMPDTRKYQAVVINGGKRDKVMLDTSDPFEAQVAAVALWRMR